MDEPTREKPSQAVQTPNDINSESNQHIRERLVVKSFNNHTYGRNGNVGDIDNVVNQSLLDQMSTSVAAGGFFNQMQTFLTGIDRFQRNILPTNYEHSGLTFITKPNLNLSTQNLRSNRRFAPLENPDKNSVPYMIRCLMDKEFGIANGMECGLFDRTNPFFTPLMNGLTGVSGWPDPVIESKTTDTGFHSEDQTFALGHDKLNKSYDLSMTFKDIQYGPIMAMFEYWINYIDSVTDGSMLAHSHHIDFNIMGYTVSVYRFVLDPAREYVTKYSQGIGCWPKSVPTGAAFNFSEGEFNVSASAKFSIPFTCNKVRYNDYASLLSFNTLVKRYCPDIENYVALKPNAVNNFRGIPYLVAESDTGRVKLTFRLPKERVDPEEIAETYTD